MKQNIYNALCNYIIYLTAPFFSFILAICHVNGNISFPVSYLCLQNGDTIYFKMVFYRDFLSFYLL